MKLVIIRHADPDYENDSLTEEGIKEAEALKERIKKMNVSYCYCSPLGRAQETCFRAMEGSNVEVESKLWLREFEGKAFHGTYGIARAWDHKPNHCMVNEANFDKDAWANEPDMLAKEDYQWVVTNLESLL